MTSQNLSSAPSFFERATGTSVKVLWILRIFPTAALICLGLSLVVWKTGARHNFCIGLAAGLLIGLIAQTFGLSHVELKDTAQRSDVQNFPITR